MNIHVHKLPMLLILKQLLPCRVPQVIRAIYDHLVVKFIVGVVSHNQELTSENGRSVQRAVELFVDTVVFAKVLRLGSDVRFVANFKMDAMGHEIVLTETVLTGKDFSNDL